MEPLDQETIATLKTWLELPEKPLAKLKKEESPDVEKLTNPNLRMGLNMKRISDYQSNHFKDHESHFLR